MCTGSNTAGTPSNFYVGGVKVRTVPDLTGKPPGFYNAAGEKVETPTSVIQQVYPSATFELVDVYEALNEAVEELDEARKEVWCPHDETLAVALKRNENERAAEAKATQELAEAYRAEVEGKLRLAKQRELELIKQHDAERRGHTKEVDSLRETNRKFHRRLQALEGARDATDHDNFMRGYRVGGRDGARTAEQVREQAEQTLKRREALDSNRVRLLDEAIRLLTTAQAGTVGWDEDRKELQAMYALQKGQFCTPVQTTNNTQGTDERDTTAEE